MIKNSSMLRPIGDSPRYQFKIRGTAGHYDELNNNSHIRNQELIKKEFVAHRNNKEEKDFDIAHTKSIKQARNAQTIASERETARYLKLLHAL
jgi:hypothetical protein